MRQQSCIDRALGDANSEKPSFFAAVLCELKSEGLNLFA